MYQSQGAYTSGSGYAYSGGNLTLNTPLLTGAAGSVNCITAGGDVRVLAAVGAPAAQDTVQALGAELSLAGANVRVDGVIALPSGKLTLQGRDSVLLADGSKLDLAGRAIAFNDVLRYSWGGDLVLESSQGGIRQEAGSLIDLSARDNDAGNLRAVALAAADGEVALLGRILGGSSGRYDAGGTEVPYRAGSVEVRAQRLGAPGSLNADFEALNRRLNEGGVTGARSFQVKQGSLTLGDALRANDINLSIDGGSLTVVGRVDASGERVGRIRLAARDGLTLASSAVLDAHGTVLRVDSYGRIIDAPNRAVVELSSGQGLLTLAGGARIDLRHGTAAARGAAAGQHDGAARGTLDLMAPRIDAAGNAGLNGAGAPGSAATYGDIAIDARGPLTIDGAKAINLTAMQRYDDARPGDPADRAGGREYQIIDQAYLEAKHADSREFIRLALLNGNLLDVKLAGLNNATYRDVFHLRPGVEIVSRTADGDLVVQGDLDLSRYRYASLNPRSPVTSAYGSGEAGALILRAKGNLDVYGSINDGFAPPPASPDDESGWVLTPGAQPFGGDVVLPRGGVQLADGTEFPGGKTLNYPLPLQATTLAAGTRLPVEAVLDQPLSLAAGTVLSGDVRDAGGQLLYAAGTVLEHALDLPAQTRLGAGTLLTRGTALKAFTWPANVALPNRYTTQAYEPNVLLMAGTITLQQGALIPSQTKLVFPEGTDYVELRPGTAADQRRNWALARMLPAGSQSWSVQLTAGADLDAADRRQVLPGPGAGKLTLADTHYNATLVKGAGLVWGPDGEASGFEPGKPVPDDMLWLCDVVEGLCLPPPRWVWAKDNWWGQPEGSPVADADLGVCEGFPDQCVENKQTTTVATHTQNFSVLRTGTGDLDLVAGGDISLMSAYGVYTAGTQSANVAPAYQLPRGRYGSTVLGDAYASNYEPFVAAGAGYQAWYPEAGGNFSLYAGGALRGDVWGKTVAGNYDGRVIDPSVGIGNWLWRQGSGSANGGDTPTAWWINFGSYAPARPEFKDSTPVLVGFTGFGALGGGNVSVRTDGDAGNIESRGSIAYPRGQGLVVAVGGTGRVAADGSVVLTGGGDIDMRIGGALNPTQSARGRVSSTGGGDAVLRRSRDRPAGRPDQPARQRQADGRRGRRPGSAIRQQCFAAGCQGQPRLRSLHRHPGQRHGRPGADPWRRGDPPGYARRSGGRRGQRSGPRGRAEQHAVPAARRHADDGRRHHLVLALDRQHRDHPVERGRQPDAQPADVAQRQGHGVADRAQYLGVGRALSLSVDPARDGLRWQYLCGGVGGLSEHGRHRPAVFVDVGAGRARAAGIAGGRLDLRGRLRHQSLGRRSRQRGQCPHARLCRLCLAGQPGACPEQPGLDRRPPGARSAFPAVLFRHADRKRGRLGRGDPAVCPRWRHRRVAQR
ncbi:Uncharacterised protein [Achromobacter sp. 2789STDY5608615]|nr:Uncharacterised protein [Achromobacter sp. 2789STDY5608615]